MCGRDERVETGARTVEEASLAPPMPAAPTPKSAASPSIGQLGSAFLRLFHDEFRHPLATPSSGFAERSIRLRHLKLVINSSPLELSCGQRGSRVAAVPQRNPIVQQQASLGPSKMALQIRPANVAVA